MALTALIWPATLVMLHHSSTADGGTAGASSSSAYRALASSRWIEAPRHLSTRISTVATGNFDSQVSTAAAAETPCRAAPSCCSIHTEGGTCETCFPLSDVTGKRWVQSRPGLALRGGGCSGVGVDDDSGNRGIDEDLYSRQLYVMGKSAMAKISKADVLISGMSGLGAEVAKNVILAGVRSVTVHDDRSATMEDLSSQLCYGEDAAKEGIPRARASVDHLRELNPYVDVRVLTGPLTEKAIKSGNYAAVLLVDEGIGFQLKINEACRRAGTAFVSASSRGAFASLFCDFGETFIVEDEDGEAAKACLVGSIWKEEGEAQDDVAKPQARSPNGGSTCSWMVDVVEGERHEFQTGDTIRFEGLRDAAGDPVDSPPQEFRIKVINPKTFTIDGGDWADGQGQERIAGGRAIQVKKPSTMSFLPLREALRPDNVQDLIMPTDFAKLDPSRQLTVHACFLCLDDFRRRHDGRFPTPGSQKDADAFLELVENSPFFSPKEGGNPEVDERNQGVGARKRRGGGEASVVVEKEVARAFSRTCAGGLSPVAGFYGGIVAQEVLKGCSSLFVPTRQFLYYDCLEALPTPLPSMKACAARGDRYDGQRAVLGDKLQRLLSAQKIFLVGAGAIGCELLKSLALMGVGCSDVVSVDGSSVEGGEGLEGGADRVGEERGVGDGIADGRKGLGRGLDRVRKHWRERTGKRDSRQRGAVEDVTAAVGRKRGRNNPSGKDWESELFAEDAGDGGDRRRADDEIEPDEDVGGGRGCDGVWGKAEEGGIVVTDMDTIEKSNLNRQFLFRSRDVGKAKSAAAAAAARRLNPLLNIKPLEKKVGADTEAFFDEDFWESAGCVVNALDNVEARLFVDSKCVDFACPLLDSGTLGTKGNTQVVLPFRSESYGSSVDPEDGSIPLCTLKHHPYLIEHTVHWARDAFDGLFQARPRNAERLLCACRSPPEEAVVMRELRGQGAYTCWQSLRDARADLEDEVPAGFGDCVDWAKRQFHTLFQESAEKLLLQHPPGSVDDEGDPFWGGVKRPPIPLKLDSSNVMHREFVWWAAFLRAGVYDVDVPRSVDDMADTSSSGGQNQPHIVAASSGSGCGVRGCDSFPTAKESDPDEQIEPLIRAEFAKLRQAAERWSGKGGGGKGRTLQPAAFEKDDDLNGHVNFVTAASNLRALNYGIPVADRLSTKRIAGKIVPAIATTTAVVAGLVCIELLKVIQEVPMDKHKNGFVNLAVPFIAFSEPLEAEPVEDVGGEGFTIWDKVVVDGAGELTPRGLIEFLKRDHGAADVTMISYKNAFLYASFMHDNIEEDDDSSDNDGHREGDRPHPVLDTPLWKLADDVDGDGAGENWMSREGGVPAEIAADEAPTLRLVGHPSSFENHETQRPAGVGVENVADVDGEYSLGQDAGARKASPWGETRDQNGAPAPASGDVHESEIGVVGTEGTSIGGGEGWRGNNGGFMWGGSGRNFENVAAHDAPLGSSPLPPQRPSSPPERAVEFADGFGFGGATWRSTDVAGFGYGVMSGGDAAGRHDGFRGTNDAKSSSWHPSLPEAEATPRAKFDPSQLVTGSNGVVEPKVDGGGDQAGVVDWFEEELGGDAAGGQADAGPDEKDRGVVLTPYDATMDDARANGHPEPWGNDPSGDELFGTRDVPADHSPFSPPGSATTLPEFDPWEQGQYSPQPPPPLYIGTPDALGALSTAERFQPPGEGWATTLAPSLEGLPPFLEQEAAVDVNKGELELEVARDGPLQGGRRQTEQSPIQQRRRRRYLDLEVFCDDDEGDELRLPPVRLDMRSACRGSGVTEAIGVGRLGESRKVGAGAFRTGRGKVNLGDDRVGLGQSVGGVASRATRGVWTALRRRLAHPEKEKEEEQDGGIRSGSTEQEE